MEAVNPDPAQTQSPEGIWVDTLLYSGLLKFDQNMHVVPDLAVALPTPSKSGKTYAFTLRSDARFADGQPVTASAVAASFTRALSRSEQSTAGWSALGNIVGARAVHRGKASTLTGVSVRNSHELVIRLKRPDYSFLDRLALPTASILDTHVIATRKDWWRYGAGTGPFELPPAGDINDLIANPHFYGGKMQVGSLQLVRVSSSAHEYALYRKHRLDATAVPATNYAAASTRPGFSSTDTGVSYYVDASSLKSMAERVALDQSLDRPALARSNSSIDALTTIVPPVVPDYPASPDPNQYEPASSQAALTNISPIEVAIPSRLSTTLLGSWLNKSWTDASERVRIGRVGSVRVFSSSELLPDPTLWLKAAGKALSDPAARTTYQSMLSRANRIEGTDNVLNQYAAYNRAEDYLLRHALIIPLGVKKQGYLISPRVNGLVATPIGLQPQDENWSSVSAS
jgi:ABC-type oligopeptide transport system substrate-binding subunit